MSDIIIKLQRPYVDELFARYEKLIGRDFSGYCNHVYRTITYAMYFLNNAEEYDRLVETVFVYHDIGLWTDHEQAYLELSIGTTKFFPTQDHIEKSSKLVERLNGLMYRKEYFAKV